MTLTDDEILKVASDHCEFIAEGTYHLARYRGWAICRVVRECFELNELVKQASEQMQREAELPSWMMAPESDASANHPQGDSTVAREALQLPTSQMK